MDRPPIPSKWRNRKSEHATRLVVDTTLGGDVVYRWLYSPRNWTEKRCTLAQWIEYQKGAKRL